LAKYTAAEANDSAVWPMTERQGQRIAELERVGHATLLREIDKDKRISELEAKICSMNDAGHKLFDENKRLKHATLLREIGER